MRHRRHSLRPARPRAHEGACVKRKKAEQAQAKLFRLVNRADRSRYEEPDRALLTDEEFALFEHIDAEQRRLSARVAPGHMMSERQFYSAPS
jgi:hypothetical protein